MAAEKQYNINDNVTSHLWSSAKPVLTLLFSINVFLQVNHCSK